MRSIVFLAPALFLGVAMSLSIGCSSEDAAEPTVDPGQEHEGGGIEAASVQGNGGAGGGVEVDYPAGPYGHDVGTVVQDFAFTGMLNPKALGYVADENTLTTISLADFYNPNSDPDRPVALLINASALWCTVCQEEARQSMGHYTYWHPKGVEFLTAIFEDNDANPADLSDIEYWSEKFELEFPVVVDPKLTLGVFFDKSASPFNMIIDTRTMQVVFAEEGLIDLGPDNETLQQIVGQ